MKEKTGLKKIVNTVLVILFLSAMGGMVYFSKTNPSVCVFIVGAVFFFLGTLGIFTNGLNLENGFLLINPQHPEEAWIPVHSVTVTILGIIFMVIAVLVAFCWLKQNAAF